MRLVIMLVMLLAGCVPVLEVSYEEQRHAADLVNQGTALLRQGALERAQAAFEVSRDFGGGAAALDGLGSVEFLKGCYRKAERYFKLAMQEDPQYHHALGNLALLYEVTGRDEQAQRLFLEVLRKEPGNTGARNNFAAYLYDHGQIHSARHELLRAEAVARHPVVKDNLIRIERTMR